MTYELFQQGPAAYIPVVLISLIITLTAYGIFPLIFAKTRKKPITKKRYTVLCYSINALVMLLFIALSSSPSSGAPYLLWTWVFSSAGTNMLTNRRVLDGTQLVEANNDTDAEIFLSDDPPAPTAAPKTEKIEKNNTKKKLTFCKKCGSPVDPSTKKCTSCGKQYFRISSRFAIVFLGLVVVLTASLNIFQYAHIKSLEKDLSSSSSRVAYMQLKQQYNSMSKFYNDLKKEHSSLEERYESLKGNYDTLYEEACEAGIVEEGSELIITRK